jgi:hypothetical protein
MSPRALCRRELQHSTLVGDGVTRRRAERNGSVHRAALEGRPALKTQAVRRRRAESSKQQRGRPFRSHCFSIGSAVASSGRDSIIRHTSGCETTTAGRRQGYRSLVTGLVAVAATSLVPWASSSAFAEPAARYAEAAQWLGMLAFIWLALDALLLAVAALTLLIPCLNRSCWTRVTHRGRRLPDPAHPRRYARSYRQQYLLARALGASRFRVVARSTLSGATPLHHSAPIRSSEWRP